jgi:hypothetical protein
MPVYRAQVSFGADTALPRDRFVITPHFRTAILPTEVDQLAEDLATALNGWLAPFASREISVRFYDAQSPAPNAPLASAVRNANAAPASAVPRELACCLSFYSEFNRGRTRGRLYIPATMCAGQGDMEPRPGVSVRTKVGALVPILTGLGGVDVDWAVYSRADDQARPVTHWFVDDEWDVQRRRGLRSSVRLTGTTTEADAP